MSERTVESSATSAAMLERIEAVTAAPIDQLAMARALHARLVRDGCATWNPRVVELPLGPRRYARIRIGTGTDSYLYVTPSGRWRLSSSVPMGWRAAVQRVIGDDLEPGPPARGGMIANKRAMQARRIGDR